MKNLTITLGFAFLIGCANLNDRIPQQQKESDSLPAEGFVQGKIPTTGLTLNCRTTDDIISSDFNRDGRLYMKAKIYTTDKLSAVIFKRGQTSAFNKAYTSQVRDLKYLKYSSGAKMFEVYKDSVMSLQLTQLNLEEIINRRDTFSANIGVLELNSSTHEGFARNFEFRCAVDSY